MQHLLLKPVGVSIGYWLILFFVFIVFLRTISRSEHMYSVPCGIRVRSLYTEDVDGSHCAGSHGDHYVSLKEY